MHLSSSRANWCSLFDVVPEGRLQVHFTQSAGLSAGSAGALILPVAGAYIVAGPVVGRLADKADCRQLMRWGLAAGAVCFAVLALPSPPLWLPPATMAALGVAEALVVIPAFPLMVKATRRELNDDATASAFASAVFNAAWSAGEGLGPVVGVWPIHNWGFAPTMVACACCLGATIPMAEMLSTGTKHGSYAAVDV